MSVRIEGSRVVVTGAGSGIGAATALRCAREGAAHVVAVDIDADAVAATAGRCAEAGATAHAEVCDVASRDALTELAERLEADHGPVDVVVNNAGVGVAGPFLEYGLDDYEWIRSINLDGVVHGCHAFGRAMVERRRGHVVNVSSGSGYMPHRDMAAYCATKSAVIAFSQCLRADWSSEGVGVSVICPGVIKTPIATNTRMVGRMDGKQQAALRAFRFGHPADSVAKAIVGAVEKNQALVPVGIESHLAYRVLRFAPGPLQAAMARAQLF
jgi:NAD(P)-dependent dehydrogenase (short-subunit alcohol dehydrogenase family)